METKRVTQFDSVFEYDSEMLRCPKLRQNKRLSLAYGQLEEIPTEIISEISYQIQFLDLSHNEFKNLSFLSEFTELQTLILDRNFQLDCPTLPFLPNLEVLWLNNCNLINIGDWLQQLQVQCPNLRQLSMMCNPVGHTQLNGVTDNEEHEYRKHVIKILPNLRLFDGVAITAAQRQDSADSVLSLTLLDDVFRKKLQRFKHFSTRLRSNLKSLEKLNATLLLRTSHG